MGLFVRNDKAKVKPTETEVAASKPIFVKTDGKSNLPAEMDVVEVIDVVEPSVSPERQAYLNQMKLRLHQQLVERLDVQNLRSVPAEVVRQEVRALVRELTLSEKGLLSSVEQEKLMDDVMDETFGLGPLESLLKDAGITDILVNRHDRVYVERRGRLELTDVQFRNPPHLKQIIDRIVAQIGRRIDETQPYVDARLPDGSRVNAIIPPLALDGPAMSIRRFGLSPMRIEDLLRLGAFPEALLQFLSTAVQARCNILISGGTGSGKTTLLNCMSRYIPPGERIITIEDAAELQLQQPHVVRLETRPPNIEGSGEVTPRDLVRNSLRMRPDRIIIGEVRGGETLDMLQAMNTGHEGSMTTIHANSPRDALSRLEVMIAMSGFEIPIRAVRQQISAAIQLVVQTQRLTGGRRKVVNVSEITGMEGEQIQMHDLFVFEQSGVDGTGHATGRFISTGIRPRVSERIDHFGLTLPQELFRRAVLE
jgi:pilus assembly protein CpaF